MASSVDRNEKTTNSCFCCCFKKPKKHEQTKQAIEEMIQEKPITPQPVDIHMLLNLKSDGTPRKHIRVQTGHPNRPRDGIDDILKEFKK